MSGVLSVAGFDSGTPCLVGAGVKVLRGGRCVGGCPRKRGACPLRLRPCGWANGTSGSGSEWLSLPLSVPRERLAARRPKQGLVVSARDVDGTPWYVCTAVLLLPTKQEVLPSNGVASCLRWIRRGKCTHAPFCQRLSFARTCVPMLCFVPCRCWRRKISSSSSCTSTGG